MTQLRLEGVKRWGKEFEAPRPYKNRDKGGEIVDLITNENVGEEKDIVQFVFNNYNDIQDPEAPGEFDEVIEFCTKEPFDPTRLAAWIDDRGNDKLQGLGKLRVPERRQTLLGLNRTLREQVRESHLSVVSTCVCVCASPTNHRHSLSRLPITLRQRD